MIDAILTNTVLPRVSRQILTCLMEGSTVERAHLSMADGQFAYAFE
jgi:type VI secretion system protein VasG